MTVVNKYDEYLIVSINIPIIQIFNLMTKLRQFPGNNLIIKLREIITAQNSNNFLKYIFVYFYVSFVYSGNNIVPCRLDQLFTNIKNIEQFAPDVLYYICICYIIYIYYIYAVLILRCSYCLHGAIY